MAGTKAGAKKAVQTIREKYGEDWYSKIGKLQQEAWEKNGRKPRGFSANPELARIAGSKGGRNSKRVRKSSK